MSVLMRIAVLLILSVSAWAGDPRPSALSKLDVGERARLMEALVCPAPVWNRLSALGFDTDTEISPTPDTTMCSLALDAFCTAKPDHRACRERSPTGAYAGYYLMRYTMPVVVMLREGLRDPTADKAFVEAGLDSIFRLLELMRPGLRGCQNLPGVRTWCTAADGSYLAVPTHRAAVAYLAAEGLRLLAECRARGAACPLPAARLDPALVRWFDVLLWDHALLEGTGLRNSLTQHVRTQPAAGGRLQQLRDSFVAPATNIPRFRFATDGWWMAVAANLLSVDSLLAGKDDPRAVALTDRQRAALRSLVTLGAEVLKQRGERTWLRDFRGNEAQGLQFDAKLWDGHEYRRFSAVNDGPRPFSTIVDASGATPRVVYAGAEESRAENVGLDSGHYRRLTWLFQTLNDVQDSLEADWVDNEMLKGVASQFAYAVHWHPCHHGRVDGCAAEPTAGDLESVPQFVNYVSGQRGWYRLTPTQPCDAGVPPYGFSTLMAISENLWWAKFNNDVGRIWARLDVVVDRANLPAPSQGDTVQCGANEGQIEWGKTYHRMVFRPDGHLSRHGLGFYAMKYWAELALQDR